MTDSPTAANAPSDSPSTPEPQPTRRVGALVALVIAVAVALYVVVLRPEPATPLVPVFEHVEAQGYEANRSLGGRYRPGDVLQVADPEPLTTPILALRSEMCFPDLEPAESPFPLPEDEGRTDASFGITGAQVAKVFPGLSINDSAATSYRLVFDRPQVFTAPKLEISGRFSDECVVRLDQVRAAGDAIEHYATVYEAVIADGMKLEVTWKRGTSADAQAEIRQQTEAALQAATTAQATGDALVTAAEVKVESSDERKTVWTVDAPVTLGYRTRPMQYQPPEAPAGEPVDEAPSEEPAEQVSAIPPLPARLLATAMLAADEPEAPTEAFNRGDDFIGRLAVQLQTDDGWQIVRPGRTFETGERFRFKIESSQPAKVFVFHQPPKGERAELWPADRGDDNHVEPGEAILVVPPPGAFEMQDDTGAETFSIALTKAAPRKNEERLGNYVLRSLGEEGTRGVGIVDDAEPWLYFEPGSDDTLAAVDFQLQHSRASVDDAS